MWFKQLQLFQLNETLQYTPEKIAAALSPLAFISCLPSMAESAGWIAPLDEEGAPLVHTANGYMMLCLQFEEKILPATVVRQELIDRVKQLEARGERKIRQKEKLSLKDEIIQTLLPRAFSKLSRVYAYIDTRNHWLVLGTTHAAKREQFLSLFKKCISEDIHPLDIKKPAPIMTHWLKTQEYPAAFSIEKNCVLQDPEQETRIIRCQQQNLLAASVQSFIKEGCAIKQLALNWEDRITFVLADDFSLRSIQFQDELLQQMREIEIESKQQQFDADFFIMTESFSGMINELLKVFAASHVEKMAVAV